MPVQTLIFVNLLSTLISVALAVSIVTFVPALRSRVASRLASSISWRVVSSIKEVLQYRDLNILENMRRQASREAAAFAAQHLATTKSFPDRFSLLAESLQHAAAVAGGHYLEFGVFRGETCNFIASKVNGPVHGFDSFEGLPEDWTHQCPKGTFAVSALPDVRPNVTLHKGWFEQTLPRWLEKHPGPIAFLHIDADLYSSTKTVFDLLGERLVPDSVIQFDELLNYPGWQQGEWKAFCEFCRQRDVHYEFLGFVPSEEQVSVRICGVGTASTRGLMELATVHSPAAAEGSVAA